MKKIAPLLIFLAGALWGTMGIFVRNLNKKNISSMEIVAIRTIITAIFLLAAIAIFDRSVFKIKIKDLWCFIGTGLFSIVFFNYCYFKAIEMTSLAVAAVLLYTAPAIVMILSKFLFGEKLSKIKLLSLAITFLGCVLVTGIIGNTEKVSFAGIVVGLLAGFGYALYSIFGRYAVNKGYGSLTITFYTFFIAGIGTCFMCDTKKIFYCCVSSGKMICFTLIFVLVSTVLPYIFYTKGLTHVENGKASIIASVEPVVATLIGIFVFHEKMKISSAIGVILVITAIVLSQSDKMQGNVKTSSEIKAISGE